jgi:hypothetical protein
MSRVAATCHFLDRRSRFVLDPTTEIISSFHVSRVREVRAPPSFDLSVNEMLIFSHVSFLDRRSRFVLDPTTEIISSFHVSRVGRIEHLVPLTFQSAKCQSLAMCPLASTTKIISRSRISRVRGVRAPPSFDFPVSEMLICDHVSCPKMDGPPAFRIL